MSPLNARIPAPCRSWHAAAAALPLLAIVSALLTATALGAPHEGDRFALRQPDGTTVEVRVWGDEYYQRVESLDGYTLVRDPDTGWVCHARLAADGKSLVSTGVRAGSPPPAGLRRGLRLPGAEVARLALATRRQLDAASAALAGAKRAPAPSTLGAVQGITLLVDFPDVPATVPAADFAAYLNQPGYAGYGNNGSVRDYFWDVSDGLLTYTNYCPTVYHRASHPFTYYDDPAVAYGLRARELIKEVLNSLNAAGFDFSTYDANGDGFIDALNMFYAGAPQNGWAVGMWPHSGSVTWSADGVSTYRYQVTNVGDGPRLSTFCHENGHMICFWPDLYDYDHDSAGVGRFCLMCSSGSATNPVEPCAPLRDLAQWCQTTILSGTQLDLPLTAGVNAVYKVPHPTLANEYYMLENRQRTGRDAGLPDDGIAIWHVDTEGNNSDQDMTPWSHYFCTLVQADGLWELEQNRGTGNATDLWAAPGFVEFTPLTTPPATWWSGAEAPVWIDRIGASGPTMTFNYRQQRGTMYASVHVEPAGTPASWRLEGPYGYLLEDAGDRELMLWDEGVYTLTWLDLPRWTLPVPAVVSDTLTASGDPLSFTGAYTGPPFTAATAITAEPGGSGLALVDVDGDGLLDIHVCRPDAPSLLLLNEGGLAFTDVAAGFTAEPAVAAVWADYDNDGDQDCYLVRDGLPNRLLRNTGGVFADVAALGLETAGPGRAAAWCDFNHDGRLDLYLVRENQPNQLFRNYGDLGTGSWMLLPFGGPPLDDAGAGRAAPWCDWENTGLPAPFVVNGGTSLLVRNYDGAIFETALTVARGDGPRAAAWGDVDGDGDFDLLVAGTAGSDALFRNAYGGLDEGFAFPLTGDGEGYGAVLADLDNDGHLDAYVPQAGLDRLLFGDGGGAFTVVPAGPAATLADGRSVACGDLDNDGALDLVLALAGQPPAILRNTIVGRGHWLQLDLVGLTGSRDAVGARVRIVAGDHAQLRQVQTGGGSASQDARRLAFGLGEATVADSVIVRWPDGSVEVRRHVPGDRLLRLVQGELTAVGDPADGGPASGGAGGTGLPAATTLHAAAPNPFNPRTVFQLDLARAGAVEVTVYSLAGRRVATLARGVLPAGRHAVAWDGRDAAGRRVASGAYVCRMVTSEGTWSRRVVMVK